MAINTVTIQHRRGKLEDFNPDRMVPGEFAFTTDGSRKVFAAFAPGDYKELASVEEVQEKLDEALKDFDDTASSIIVSKSGTSIVATDSSDNPLKGLKTFGKSTQRTTTCAQLMKINIKYDSHNNVEFNEDNGNIILNGTATENLWNTLCNAELEEGKTYTLSASESLSLAVCNNATNDVITSKGLGMKSVTFMATNTGAYYIVANNESGASFSNIKANIMLNEGSTALPFEPYTGGKASPSPEYPQPIESVGDDGSVEVGVYGGNLLDKNDESICSHVYINMSGTLLGFISKSNDYSVVLKIKPNTSYTIYCKDSTRLRACTTTELLPEIENEYASVNVNGIQKDGNTSLTITSGLNDKYLYINLSETEELFVQALQTLIVSVGTQVIPYEPYKSKQSLMVSTPNGLPGIKVTDATLATYTDENGQMWCADYVDFERGVYVQRVYIETITGNEQDFVSTVEGRTHNRLQKKARDSAATIQYITTFPFTNYYSLTSSGKNGACAHNDLFYLRWTGSVDGDVALLRNMYESGNPCRIIYVLGTPIETPLSAEEIEAYKALTTNYPTTTILNDANAYMSLKYAADTQNHIEQNYVPKSAYTALEERVATLEKNAL